MITQARLKELLHYDQESGLFTWLIRSARVIKIGDVAGRNTKSGYVRIKIHGKEYMAHRLAWLYVHGELPIHEIDHINCIRNDNRISNLRTATHSQNMMNRGVLSTNKSGFKGVCFVKRSRKWSACCCKVYLGLFKTAELAFDAYDNYSNKHHGKFKFNSGDA